MCGSICSHQEPLQIRLEVILMLSSHLEKGMTLGVLEAQRYSLL